MGREKGETQLPTGKQRIQRNVELWRAETGRGKRGDGDSRWRMRCPERLCEDRGTGPEWLKTDTGAARSSALGT